MALFFACQGIPFGTMVSQKCSDFLPLHKNYLFHLISLNTACTTYYCFHVQKTLNNLDKSVKLVLACAYAGLGNTSV